MRKKPSAKSAQSPATAAEALSRLEDDYLREIAEGKELLPRVIDKYDSLRLPRASYARGVLSEFGLLGKSKSIEEAFFYFQKNRDSFPPSARAFATYLLLGKAKLSQSPAADRKQAIKFYENAVEMKHCSGADPIACYALISLKVFQLDDQFITLEEKVLKRHLEDVVGQHPRYTAAKVILGICYFYGLLGIAQNDQKAVSCFDEAATRSHLEAQYYLAVMQYQGIAKPKNRHAACLEFQRLAEKGHRHAMFYLAYLHHREKLETETGIRPEQKQAIHWYQKAGEKKLAKADNNLAALFYVSQEGESKDNERKIMDLFKRAADGGHDLGQVNLVRKYAAGLRGSFEPIDIVKYYDLAAKQGNPEAHYLRGIKLLEKTPLDIKDKKSADVEFKAALEGYQEWLEMDKNNEIALCGLAECYAYGYGAAKNLAKAEEYYDQAIRLGCPDASFQRAKFHEKTFLDSKIALFDNSPPMLESIRNDYVVAMKNGYNGRAAEEVIKYTPIHSSSEQQADFKLAQEMKGKPAKNRSCWVTRKMTPLSEQPLLEELDLQNTPLSRREVGIMNDSPISNCPGALEPPPLSDPIRKYHSSLSPARR